MPVLTPQNLIGDLVERMTESPPHCMFCGQGNVADTSGQVGPFLATRLDRAWGDSCYICPPCGAAVGATFGLIGPDQYEQLQRALKKAKKELHNATSEVDRLRLERKALRQRLDAVGVAKKVVQQNKKKKTTSKRAA